MTRFDQIAKKVQPNEGVLLIVTGPDNKFEVHLLQRGTITEAQIERHMNVIFTQVMRQRHARDWKLSDPPPIEIDELEDLNGDDEE